MRKPEVMGYAELALASPYGVQTLREVKLTQAVNAHARLSLTGLMPVETKDQAIHQASTNDEVALYQMKNGQRVQPLFKGHVTHLAVRMVRGVYQIEIEAVSATAQLDYKAQSRSFQNEQMTYEKLLREVLKAYAGADVIDEASKGAKTQAFILQYRETDWAFLQRLASHFRTVLVPAIHVAQPKVWFGLPEGKAVQLEASHYTLRKDRTTYLQAAQNDPQHPLTSVGKAIASIPIVGNAIKGVKKEVKKVAQKVETAFNEFRRDIGITFYCTWDSENGIGIRLLNEEITEVGYQDVAI
ncbi:contractile injection system protein, VgrG/Pvc8 family [Metasolibacillus meyeri]|uniref:Contractile injection system protein, VgrG/Pvc8 family n=1 Tax=Metasolibacillus meyeri TaxID=1071052 RepID=A0AAW9NWW6_9BACL|nr:contractile injection system protein, VgrG/Pvc8 family [Metasolibacillus meyeri]MEC1180069.1 contractile injection system protein, VgrG/Pvc8 family [Metasolibacillus meyeri]